jgi:hypothetical protein
LRLASILFLLLFATPALAQPSLVSPEPDAAAVNGEKEPTPADAYVANDAAAVRASLTPTAMINPRGSVSVELGVPAHPVGGMAGARISFHDRFEIGAGAIFLLNENTAEDPHAGAMLSAKLQVWRRPTGAVALQVSYVKTGDQYDDDGFIYTAVGSKCFGDGCRTLLTGHVTLLPYTTWRPTDTTGNGVEDGALAVVPGASLVHGRRFKLVLDAALGEGEREDLATFYAGVRYARPRWAFDAGVFVGDEPGDDEALPMPLAAVTGRF